MSLLAAWVLWLGMQGQDGQGKLTGSTHNLSAFFTVTDKPITAQGTWVEREHVFEIRTKTEDHGTAKDERSHGLGGTPHCDDPEDVLESPNQCDGNTCNSMYIAPHCVRVTRELWLDGKRLGIIKGLD